MSSRDEVARQAQALSPDDRAFVAELIEESLSPDGQHLTSDELLAELERRSAEYRSGA